MPTTYLFGLGNPGARYAHSRHNAGRDAVLHIVAEQGAIWERDKHCRAEMSTPFMVGEVCVQGVVSETYMNDSGSVARCVVEKGRRADISGDALILVHDDIDLPLGTVRVAKGRGAGGHRGVEDVMRHLGTKDVLRVRIGVLPVRPDGSIRKPRTGEQVVRFVLRKGDVLYSEHLEAQCVHVADAITVLLTVPYDRAVEYIHRNYSGVTPAL
jgi:PTH1 family peptidyl-tRNA hydrolase